MRRIAFRDGRLADRGSRSSHKVLLKRKRPLQVVVKYIGELRKEVQEKHGVDFERHVSELAKLRDAARDKGAWAAAINAEVARGKAGGLYIDQKVIMTGSLDSLSEKELEAKLKQILEDHKNIINISSEDTEEISKEQLASYEESK
jgi:hypothetical protein